MRGISQEWLDRAGVYEDGERVYFPILNVYGHRVGSIARQSRGTKYDHHIDDRSNTYLYGEQILPNLFYGKPVVVVEGVLDCLSVLQEGIPCLAATTNHLSRRKIEKIRRYTNRVVLWFDSDSFGEHGLDKTVKALSGVEGMRYRVFRVNEAKDPNDLLQKHPEVWKKKIEELRELMNNFR